jgi:hypothetical protein
MYGGTWPPRREPATRSATQFSLDGADDLIDALPADRPRGPKESGPGRKPWDRARPTPIVPPPPPTRGRGQGGEGRPANPRLTPWAIFRRPCRGLAPRADIRKQSLRHPRVETRIAGRSRRFLCTPPPIRGPPSCAGRGLFPNCFPTPGGEPSRIPLLIEEGTKGWQPLTERRYSLPPCSEHGVGSQGAPGGERTEDGCSSLQAGAS